jgi:pentatricopeptide repeat protein
MILDAVSHQAEPSEAPLIAESLLLQSFAPINTVHMSTQLLQAWALSGRREAGSKMMDILKFTMIEKNIIPNQVSFGIVLRYWGRHGAIGPMEHTIKLMKSIGVVPSISNLEQILHGYAVDGQVDKAHKIFRQMIVEEQSPPSSTSSQSDSEISSRQLIFEGAQTILMTVRNILGNSVLHGKRHKKALAIGEDVYRWITNNPKFQDESSDDVVKVSGTMMDIYSTLRQSERVEAIYQFATASNHSAANRQKLLNIFIKTMSMDRAMEILQQTMKNPDRARPDRTTFNTVMDICANQNMTRENNQSMVANAWKVFEWMQEFQLSPDLISYNTMLKCLAKSKAPGAAKLALEILDKMTDSTDDEVRPNIISYSLVTRALLEAKKDKQVAKIKRRMEEAGIHPDMRFNAEILSYYSKIGSPESAIKALKLLNKMRGSNSSHQEDFSMKPNIICFNLVLSALARGKPPDFAKKMCSLYEVIQRTKDVEPTIITYTVLLGALTKCDPEYLEKAESLLNFMAKSPLDIRPNHRHFTMLIRGYIRCKDNDSATRILMQVVQKCVDNPHSKEMVPQLDIIDQVAEGWLRAGELVKATLLVEKIRELADAGIFPLRPSRTLYGTLRASWNVSSHKERVRYLQLINSRITSPTESNKPSRSINAMKSSTIQHNSSNNSTEMSSTVLAFDEHFVDAGLPISQSSSSPTVFRVQSEQQRKEDRAKELQSQVNELERNLNMHLSNMVPKIEKLKQELSALEQITATPKELDIQSPHG